MKNIKEYLKYYIGQPHRFKNNGGTGYGKWHTLTVESLAAMLKYGTPERAQLCLRPLSSMTEEEAARWFDIDQVWSSYTTEQKAATVLRNWIPNNRVWMNKPESFHYLLSIGIDLFSLLDSGLAVNENEKKEE